MPLMPKRVKYRKVQRGSRSGMATAGTNLAFGECGLKSLDRGWLSGTQIEACRVAINRHLKRKGRLYPRVPGQAGHEEADRDPEDRKSVV